MDDVLERYAVANRNGATAVDWLYLAAALAAEVRALRANRDSEASHRLALCADNERFLAEIRELRKDRERLDWVLVNDVRLIWSMRDQKHYVVDPSGNIVGTGAYGKKMALDAAIASRGEDVKSSPPLTPPEP